jgi:hypothetical protein
MDILAEFLVTVLGGLVTYYIIKWLDEDDHRKDNN